MSGKIYRILKDTPAYATASLAGDYVGTLRAGSLVLVEEVSEEEACHQFNELSFRDNFGVPVKLVMTKSGLTKHVEGDATDLAEITINEEYYYFEDSTGKTAFDQNPANAPIMDRLIALVHASGIKANMKWSMKRARVSSGAWITLLVEDNDLPSYEVLSGEWPMKYTDSMLPAIRDSPSSYIQYQEMVAVAEHIGYDATSLKDEFARRIAVGKLLDDAIGRVTDDKVVHFLKRLPRLLWEGTVLPCSLKGCSNFHRNIAGQSAHYCCVTHFLDVAEVEKKLKELGGDPLRAIPENPRVVMDNLGTLDPDIWFVRASRFLPPLTELQREVNESSREAEGRYTEALERLGCPSDRKALESGPWIEPTHAARPSQPVKSVYSVWTASLQTMPALSLVVTHLAELCGEGCGVAVSLKGTSRGYKKIYEDSPASFMAKDFSGLCDVARASVIVDTLPQARKVYDVLRESLDGCSSFSPHPAVSFRVVRLKNRFARPCQGGYRDIFCQAVLNGVVCEVQVIVRPIAHVKSKGGHMLYRWQRWLLLNTEKKAVANGYGATQELTGTVYEGQFAEGEPHGLGVYYLNNGDVYAGGFAGGLKEGEGAYFFNDGMAFIGHFAKGLRDRIGTTWSLANEVEVARYVNGVKHGVSVRYNSTRTGALVSDHVEGRPQGYHPISVDEANRILQINEPLPPIPSPFPYILHASLPYRRHLARLLVLIWHRKVGSFYDMVGEAVAFLVPRSPVPRPYHH